MEGGRERRKGIVERIGVKCGRRKENGEEENKDMKKNNKDCAGGIPLIENRNKVQMFKFL